MVKTISPFKFNPFPMVFSHYGIDPSAFPKNTYLAGSSLLSIVTANFNVKFLDLYTTAESEEEMEMLENLGLKMHTGICKQKLRISYTDSILSENLGLVSCYMNIHDTKIIIDFAEVNLPAISCEDAEFIDFLKQLIFVKEVKVEGRTISIFDILPGLKNGMMLVGEIAYDVIYILDNYRNFEEILTSARSAFDKIFC